MIFNLTNPYEKEKFKTYINKLIEQEATIEVKKKFPNRTLSQNRYLHLILSWFACETGYSVDEVKIDIFKRLCNKDWFERTRKNKRGEMVEYLRSSKDLDTSEMTTCIERFRNYAASEGTYLPSPDERSFLQYIEREVERHKEWL